MRNYQVLDKAILEQDNVLRLTTAQENPDQPILAMSREGSFVSISASFGPLELALRLQYNELVRRLKNLYPVPGLATTRQVGTGNSYMALGLTKDNRLVMRPSIVADASGHITFNLVASAEVYQTLRKWLDVDSE
jgi:hypothetical protein